MFSELNPLEARVRAKFKKSVFINDEYFSIYGKPKIFAKRYRILGSRKYFICTRVILPSWAATFKISFIRGVTDSKTLMDILNMAGYRHGLTVGYNFGPFRVCAESDKDFQKVIKTGRRAAQIKAIQSPKSYSKEVSKILLEAC